MQCKSYPPDFPFRLCSFSNGAHYLSRYLRQEARLCEQARERSRRDRERVRAKRWSNEGRWSPPWDSLCGFRYFFFNNPVRVMNLFCFFATTIWAQDKDTPLFWTGTHLDYRSHRLQNFLRFIVNACSLLLWRYWLVMESEVPTRLKFWGSEFVCTNSRERADLFLVVGPFKWFPNFLLGLRDFDD